eukprot:8247950-Pyramimonas_sp.AAC.2
MDTDTFLQPVRHAQQYHMRLQSIKRLAYHLIDGCSFSKAMKNPVPLRCSEMIMKLCMPLEGFYSSFKVVMLQRILGFSPAMQRCGLRVSAGANHKQGHSRDIGC